MEDQKQQEDEPITLPKEEDLGIVKLFFISQYPYGYEKKEPDSILKIENQFLITHTETANISQPRQFGFDYIFDPFSKREIIFEIAVKKLFKCSLNLSTDNTLIVYEKNSLQKSAGLIGITNSQKSRSLMHLCLEYFFAQKAKHNLFYIKCLMNLAIIDSKGVHDCFELGGPGNSQQNDNSQQIYQNEEDLEDQIHFEELKEIYLKSEADIVTVVDFVNDVLKKIDSKFNLFLSIAFEKEITKYGKIIHVFFSFSIFLQKPKGRINFVCIEGEEDINLENFLNQDKNSIQTENIENYVEKCILHYLSYNFNQNNLPYQNIPTIKFLAPIFTKSHQKYFALQSTFQTQNIQTSLNDLLYSELCKDVSIQETNQSHNNSFEQEEEDTLNENSIYQDTEIMQGEFMEENDKLKLISEINQLNQQRWLLQNELDKLENISQSKGYQNEELQIYEQYAQNLILTLEELTKETNAILGKPDTNITQYSLQLNQSISTTNYNKQETKIRPINTMSYDTTIFIQNESPEYQILSQQQYLADQLVKQLYETKPELQFDVQRKQEQEMIKHTLSRLIGLEKELIQNFQEIKSQSATIKEGFLRKSVYKFNAKIKQAQSTDLGNNSFNPYFKSNALLKISSLVKFQNSSLVQQDNKQKIDNYNSKEDIYEFQEQDDANKSDEGIKIAGAMFLCKQYILDAYGVVNFSMQRLLQDFVFEDPNRIPVKIKQNIIKKLENIVFQKNSKKKNDCILTINNLTNENEKLLVTQNNKNSYFDDQTDRYLINSDNQQKGFIKH